MKIAKEVKVGVVALLAIGIMVWGFNFLKGTNLFVKSRMVYTVYPKVPGLSVSAPIIINGVQSGVVDAIYFHPDKSSRVVVRLSITEEGIVIPNDSRADLISLDFLGTKAIGLNLGKSSKEIQPGDTLQSFFEKSMLDDVSEQILPLKQKSEDLMDSLQLSVVKFNQALDNINVVFDDKNKRNLAASLKTMRELVENMNVVANNLNSTINGSVKPTIKTYKNLGDSLAALDLKSTLLKAQRTLDEFSAALDKVNKGEGTLGQLMKNDSLYRNLEQVTMDMDSLAVDLKEHPKRYVHFSIFGRRDKEDKKKK
ncbi:MAG: MCE family protein [Flavobacteriales bacterium]|nr:MCE family protein [Flavobacteriales bacterium]